jgi:hypothetical protein
MGVPARPVKRSTRNVVREVLRGRYTPRVHPRGMPIFLFAIPFVFTAALTTHGVSWCFAKDG